MQEGDFQGHIQNIHQMFPKEVVFDAQEMTSRQVQVLCRALTDNTSVESLSLVQNNLDVGSIAAIAELLKHNTNIRHLTLAGNELTREMVAILANGLESNVDLRSLDLSHTNIGNSRIFPLVEGLKVNKGISSLNLNCNLIGDRALTALSDLLKHNNNLHKLSLKLNMIFTFEHGVGIKSFFDAIAEHPNLQHLDISQNDLGLEQTLSLLEALRKNSQLQVLDITDVGAEDDLSAVIETLKETLKTNSNLLEVRGIGDAEDLDQSVDGLFYNIMSAEERLNELSLDEDYSISKLDRYRQVDDYTGSEIDLNALLYRHWPQSVFLSKSYDAPGSSMQVPPEILQRVGEFIGKDTLRTIAIQSREDLKVKHVQDMQQATVIDPIPTFVYPNKGELVTYNQQSDSMAAAKTPILYLDGIDLSDLSSRGIKELLRELHPDKNGGEWDKDAWSKVMDYKEKMDSKVGILSNGEAILGSAVDKLHEWQSMLHKASIGFKVLDIAVDTVRLYTNTTLDNFLKVATDFAHLSGMISGLNPLSAAANAVPVGYSLYQGDWWKAAEQVAISGAFIALPYAVSVALGPHGAILYGTVVTACVGYKSLSNAYSFYRENFSSQETEELSDKNSDYTDYTFDESKNDIKVYDNNYNDTHVEQSEVITSGILPETTEPMYLPSY